MTDIKKLNKSLRYCLEADETGAYDKATSLFNDLCAFAGVHGWTHTDDRAKYIKDALNNLPRPGEISVNLRINKDLIMENEQIAEFLSLVFDLCEKLSGKDEEVLSNEKIN